jgi:DUF2934 family protein
MGLNETKVMRRLRSLWPKTVSFEDLIRQRVHEIWLARGCEPGSDVSNWLQAEKEILQSK